MAQAQVAPFSRPVALGVAVEPSIGADVFPRSAPAAPASDAGDRIPGDRPDAGGGALPKVPALSPFPGARAGDEFVISSVVFEGNRALATEDLERVAAPFLNRPVRLVELEELRQCISRVYIERGYVTSGAVIPPQGEWTGVLRLRIIEGHIEAVRLSGMEGLRDAYVVSRLVKDDEVLSVDVLQERFRLLLADPLFDRLNARLQPGSDLGRSVLEVDVVRARRYQVSLFANNYLAPAVGSESAGIEAIVRDLTGWGDTLALTAYGSGGTTNWDLSYVAPLYGRATTFSLRLGQASSLVVEEPLNELDISSRVDTLEVGLAHPVLDETRRKFWLGLMWSGRQNPTDLEGQPFSFTAGEQTGRVRVRDLRFYQDFVGRFERVVLALRSTFTWGSNNLAADSPIPGQAARDYRFWVGQAQAAVTLPDNTTQLVIRGAAQHASAPLVALEQFSVGGRYTVRGYRENQLVRDNGYFASAEIHYPLIAAESPKRRLTLIPFLDLGQASNRDQPAAQLASIGLGIQWTVGDFEGEVFYGRRLKDPPVITQGDLQDRGIHLQVRYRLF